MPTISYMAFLDVPLGKHPAAEQLKDAAQKWGVSEIAANVLKNLHTEMDAARADAARIAADKRFTPAHRAEQVRSRLADASARLAALAAEWAGALAPEKARLADAARPAMPAGDDLARLLYVQRALEAQYAGSAAGDIPTAWQAALEARDLLAARVFRDFGPAWHRQHSAPTAAQGPDGTVMQVPPDQPDFEALMRLTDEALLTPEQIAARDALAALDEHITALQRIVEREAPALGRLQFDDDGQVIDEMRAAYMRVFGLNR